MVNKANQVRIISGFLGGRKIQFPQHQDLRPTGDRAKETLFNWLNHSITNARCLDCFAGSGSLGFEALSRGASYVTFVEQDLTIAAALSANIEKFSIQNSTEIIIKNVVNYLKNTAQNKFDIVFLDPPYSLNLLDQIFTLLKNQRWISERTVIYYEDAKPLQVNVDDWQILRQVKAGKVYFGIVTLASS